MFWMLRFLIPLIFVSVGHSTPSCNAPTEDWFLMNVIGKTTNVVYVEIFPSKDLTDKKRVQILKNITYEDNRPFELGSFLIVGNWWSEPVFGNPLAEESYEAILFLKSVDDGYELSNDKWKKCRPSIIYKIHGSDKFLIPFKEKERSIKENLIDIEKTIKGLEFQC